MDNTPLPLAPCIDFLSNWKVNFILMGSHMISGTANGEGSHQEGTH